MYRLFCFIVPYGQPFHSCLVDVDSSSHSPGNVNELPRNHFRSASNSSTGSNHGGWDDEGIEQDHEDDLDSVDPRPLSPRTFENMNVTFATAR